MLRLVLALALLGALPAAGQELKGTLKKIKDSGAVVIGYRESSLPFSYLNAAGRPIGYSIDLCLEIVEEAKDTLGLDDVAVKYVPVNPDNRIGMVASGKVDLECGSTTSNAPILSSASRRTISTAGLSRKSSTSRL